MKASHLFLMAASAVALAACDNATTAGATPDQFRQADANHDGRLSQGEYEHLLAIRASAGDPVAARAVKSNLRYNTYDTRFKDLDDNGDGFVSNREIGLN